MIHRPLILFSFTAVLINIQATQASGYHFGTQSVTSQSTANASAAEAADASSLFSNPAGLSKLQHNEISATVTLLAPNIKYYDGEAFYHRGAQVNPATNSSSGKITKDLVIAPHLYSAFKIDPDLTLGLGVYVPFGSKTEYSQDSVLRYSLNKTELTTIAVEPVVAYQLNPQHAVAVGAIAQYSNASLRKYADWSSSSGTYSGLMDGHGDIKGKDWGFGYHLGWLWDINERTRVGVNYRSKVTHNLKGTASWSADGPVAKQLYDAHIGKTIEAGGTGYIPHEKASLKIVTPESLSLHGMYKLNPEWNLFGDLTWTRHSRFNRGELQFSHPKITISGKPSNQTVVTPNWRNTYKIALGTSYQYSQPLQLRAGIAYDQSPVRNPESRLTTLPDNDRIWFSVGAKYNLNKQHSLNVAYSHVHIKDASIRQTGTGGTTVDSDVKSSARYKSHANILGLQYNYLF